MANESDFSPLDPEGHLFPMRGGIGRQGYPNDSPFNFRDDLGAGPRNAPAEPPPLPPGANPQAIADHATVNVHFLLRMLLDPSARESIHALLEEGNRQYFRPVHLPPWPEQPVGGRGAGGVSALTTVNASTTVDLVTIPVPLGEYGFAAWLGQDTQNDILGAGQGDWANLEWSLGLLQGTNFIPLPQHSAFTAQKGQIEAPCRVNMFIPGGWSGVLRVRNTSLANILAVRGRLEGWTWPQAMRMGSVHVNENVIG